MTGPIAGLPTSHDGLVTQSRQYGVAADPAVTIVSTHDRQIVFYLGARMTPLGWYLVIATLLAAVSFLAAEWIRDPRTPPPSHPEITALGAGVLWPVLLIGGAQLAIVVTIVRLIGSPAEAPVPVVVG